MKIYYLKIREN